MSRIGNKAVPIPKGVDVKVANGNVTIKGPKGQIVHSFVPKTNVSIKDGNVIVGREDNGRAARAYHGLMRALVANMVHGVSQGHIKELEIIGIGYKADVQGKKLNLNLGLSHPIVYPFPDGIKIEVKQSPKSTILEITGVDKELVGHTAAILRGYRPPDSYKGKGVRYKGEIVRLKAGKQ
jgi:large subunit ribosomal protein L6